MSVRQERSKAKRKQVKFNKRFKKKFSDKAFYHCYYCKFVFLLSELTVEHINPKCFGGTNDPENLTLACAPCNKERGKIAWEQKRAIVRQQYFEQNYVK